MIGADEFDGSDDYVKINNIGTLLNNKRNITFSLWVNTASDGTTWDNPLSFGNGQFRFETGDPITNLHVFNSGIDNDEIIEALGFTTLDAWNFITFASNDSTWSLYVDGSVRDSGTTDGGLNAGSDLFLGVRFDLSDQWKGLIDEVRISKMTRSYDWIATEYNNQNETNSFYTVGFEEINPDCWLYRKSITIGSSQVTGDLVDFPILINITDSDLRDKARLDGYDIVFTESDGITRLDHEIESYDSLTGELTAWVRTPDLSSSSDTEIYLYYGNSDISYSMENPQGVWDDNFIMVQHLNENSGTHYDSTRYGNNGAEYIDLPGTQNASGKIDGAIKLDGTDDYIDCGNDTSMNIGTNNFTINAWIYPKELDNSIFWDNVLFSKVQDDNNRYYFRLRDEDNMQFYSVIGGSIYRASGSLDDGYDFTKNSWYMISWVIDRTEGDNGTLKVYHNGNLAGNFSFNEDISGVDFSNNGGGWIGAHNDSEPNPPKWHFNGTIDEVRISNVARSSEWIATQYNNQNDTSTFYSLGNEVTTNDFNDVIVGAYGYDNNRGRAYIFFGGSEFTGEISAANANVIINGSSQNDRMGWDLSGAGDVNNDGVGDVIIGAPGNNSNTGAAYIFYGNDSMPSLIDAIDANLIIVGGSGGDEFGHSVSGVKDVNGDGYDEVIVGAPGYNSNQGRAYIFHCVNQIVGYNDIITADKNPNTVTIYNGTDDNVWETPGALSVGTNPYFVFVGDANNDGFNDIVTADNTGNTVTIYNGTSSGGWEPKCTLDVGSDPWSVYVGDANNDGYNDILTADWGDGTVTIYKGATTGWEPKLTLYSPQGVA
jgi:hypothetical protein